MIVGCDGEPSSGAGAPSTLRCTYSRRCNAHRAWLVGFEADLRLQPLIRLSLLTLEPVDGPSDEDGYDGGV